SRRRPVACAWPLRCRWCARGGRRGCARSGAASRRRWRGARAAGAAAAATEPEGRRAPRAPGRDAPRLVARARVGPLGHAAHVVGGGELDREREGARVAGMDRAHPHHLVRDLLALVVADGQHHRILPGAALGGVADLALHLQRAGDLGGVGGLVEAQVVAARRAACRAFQDHGLAVRAGARGTCRTGACAHWTTSRPALSLSLAPLSSLPLACCGASPSQPHSTWPRMREPEATVRVPALTSPMSTADGCSSTRSADSMLPSSSPATVTRLARTPPLRRAPPSMVRSPSTFTSPLQRPAMRTWPLPEILPSMVRSEAIADARAWRAAAAAGRAGWKGTSAGSKAAAAGLGSRAGGAASLPKGREESFLAEPCGKMDMARSFLGTGGGQGGRPTIARPRLHTPVTRLTES